MRCVGIDYGEKRIGLSYGDDIGVAVPLPALPNDKDNSGVASLLGVIKERRATDIVIGYPYNMNGSVGFKAKEVDQFVEKLSKYTDLPVHRIDERLTTQEVKNAMGKKRNDELRRSGKIDSAAAALILQDFLNQKVEMPDYDELVDEDCQDEYGD